MKIVIRFYIYLDPIRQLIKLHASLTSVKTFNKESAIFIVYPFYKKVDYTSKRSKQEDIAAETPFLVVFLESLN